jgi:hypothetical protein
VGKRGPKSALELAHLRESAGDGLERIERAPAPYDLTDAQAQLWEAIVSRLPASWFPVETWPLLAQYVRHVDASRRVAMLIEQEVNPTPDADGQVPELDLNNYRRLLVMQALESRAMMSLATKMRLTQQSTRSIAAVKPLAPVARRRPWEG